MSRRQAERPNLERTIALTDGVVAIAMTLLVLPLVDEVGSFGTADALALWDALWNDNRQLLLSFLISFLVIYAFWTAHGTLYRRLIEAGVSDARWLGQINLGWLLVIAFLPFPTALIGREVTTGTAPVYLGTMLVLSALTYAMTVVVQRAVDGPLRLAWLTTAVIGLCTAVSLFSPQLGMYLLLLLIVAGRIERSSAERERQHLDS